MTMIANAAFVASATFALDDLPALTCEKNHGANHRVD
jgi:hypothetical protein